MEMDEIYQRIREQFGMEDGSDEIEVDVVTVDGVEYTELAHIPLDGEVYVYLSNLEDPTSTLIQRLTVEDGEEYLNPLRSQEEYQRALAAFYQKMLGD